MAFPQYKRTCWDKVMLQQKSFYLVPEKRNQKWFEVDASGKVLGRLASEIASILRGKRRPSFTPSVDCGDFVVVINAKQVCFTGNKLEQKRYYRHSGHVGGLKSRTAKQLLEYRPELIITNAVKGMLPKTSLGRKQLKKLKVYAGDEHPHTAQNPQKLEF